MNKRLVRVGNSLAITIDKPVLELLGFDRQTIVHMSTDGLRLVIEAAGSDAKPRTPLRVVQPPAPPPDPDFELRRKAAATLLVLFDRYQLNSVRIQKLHPGETRPLACIARLDAYAMTTTDEGVLLGMRRNALCLAEIRAGHSIDEVIEMALLAFPPPTAAARVATTT